MATLCPSFASAHIAMDAPKARSGGPGEVAPCAGGNGTVSSTPTTFQAGETITVEWREQVDHPATYRISLAPTEEDLAAESASVTVLADDLPDNAESTYAVEVTLPNEPCEACVLQVIQLAGFQDYYQCADIVIAGAAGGTTPDAGSPDGETSTDPAGFGGSPASNSSTPESNTALGGAGSEVDTGPEPTSGSPAPSVASSGAPGTGTPSADTSNSGTSSSGVAEDDNLPPPVATNSSVATSTAAPNTDSSGQPPPAALAAPAATPSDTNGGAVLAPQAPAADEDAGSCSYHHGRNPARLAPVWAWLGAFAAALVYSRRRQRP